MTDPMSKTWQLTIIPYDQDIFDKISKLVELKEANYVVIGKETCPTTNQLHFHAHISFI